MSPVTDDAPEIEIPDPEKPLADDAPPPQGPPDGHGDAPVSPYKNLLVPLVVVPALIGMVIVVIVSLFGALAGSEASPRENLERLLQGGFNERQQAAFNLVRQVLEEKHGARGEDQAGWDIDATFLPDLRAALEATGVPESEKEVAIPLVLASLMAQLGDAEGAERLAAMTRLEAGLDPEGQYRMYAAWTLGAIGQTLPEEARLAAAETLIGLLESPDEGLVLVATAGLQNLPSPGTRAALGGMLGSRSLDQRGTAALSLAALEDPAGRGVLEEMLEFEPYEQERAQSPAKWPPRSVSESRKKALAALAGLGLAPARDVLERMADDDPDAELRALARELLADG